jgi:RHS repeat-associated protein
VTGASTANFYYDADGAQVKTVVNGVTTYYVGNHYEVKNSVVTKYYFAGATRLAVRTGTTLSYLLSDHIGSSSVTTDANGVKTASALYKAFGETRFSSGNLGTDYKFTGQREEASLGIYFFNARWFDPSLGRFTSPDSIVPTSTQGTQAWDRYAFVNNNPVRYTDPTGHRCVAAEGEDDGCLNDDGSTGSGFTGTASSSSGPASNVAKGCGGFGQRNCQGDLVDIVQKDDDVTKWPNNPNNPNNPHYSLPTPDDIFIALAEVMLAFFILYFGFMLIGALADFALDVIAAIKVAGAALTIIGMIDAGHLVLAGIPLLTFAAAVVTAVLIIPGILLIDDALKRVGIINNEPTTTP